MMAMQTSPNMYQISGGYYEYFNTQTGMLNHGLVTMKNVIGLAY